MAQTGSVTVQTASDGFRLVAGHVVPNYVGPYGLPKNGFRKERPHPVHVILRKSFHGRPLWGHDAPIP